MSTLGTRTPQGKITTKPDTDCLGNPYQWGAGTIKVTVRDPTRFYILPPTVKPSAAMEAGLFAEEENTTKAAVTADAPTAMPVADEAPKVDTPSTSRRKSMPETPPASE
jgi:hypothetical protein